ncbi:cation transporter dimerization domain-containing protein [Staphylococcus aureus]
MVFLKKQFLCWHDGFNETELEAYRNDILEVDEVQEVKSIKGRYHGSSVFIDVTIVVDANLSFSRSASILAAMSTSFAQKRYFLSIRSPRTRPSIMYLNVFIDI